MDSPLYKLDFLGGAGTVTGSKTLFRFDSKAWLVDCGLFQGSKELRALNWEPFKIPAGTLEGVILTHAHLDHSGYIPRLVKLGYQNPVYCSQGTADFCEILWRDAAKIQEEDAAYANKTGYSPHKPAVPLFSEKDVDAALRLLKPLSRDQWIPLSKNLDLRLTRSGHIIGSSFVELRMAASQSAFHLVFSGDLGHHRSLTLKGPRRLEEADVLVLESTYGDRLHDKLEPLESLAKPLKLILDRQGVALIPAFAVGRAQEILYALRILQDQGKIPLCPVYLDSPMAHKATDVFRKHIEDQKLDSAFARSGWGEFFPNVFKTIESMDESLIACMEEGPLIIIAGAGMLNGGRMLHHLKKRLPSAQNGVVFTGYLAEGTKGRFLLEKAKIEGNFRIHHTQVDVQADIFSISSFSAHADYEEMIEWVEAIKRKPHHIWLNHGSQESCLSFRKRLKEKFPGISIEVAHSAPPPVIF